MNLGFYYHIPVIPSSFGIKIPAYLGVFLVALSDEVDKLTLFMHQSNNLDDSNANYIINKKNIHFVSLGPKTPAWDRFIRPGKTLNRIECEIQNCDVVRVRAPSPLAPSFHHKYRNLTKISYLVVGDYIDDSKNLEQPFLRKLVIQILSLRNDKQLTKVLKRSTTLVNSAKLFKKYSPVVKDLHLVKTTTLTHEDFFKRDDTCQLDEIRILYTGSFSFSKGLLDLIDSFAVLSQAKRNLSLHFVGWETMPQRPFEQTMRRRIIELGLSNLVYFHGFKNVGSELNEMYRMSDIYILPSYQEGFPRTIWEAMANSLPVIATRVGSIPHYLENRCNAVLIEPRRPDQIVTAITEIINNHELRRLIIKNAYELVKENTLEIQTKKLVKIINASD
jgi:glycosyltransferase involved in cell wall biosynthesis